MTPYQINKAITDYLVANWTHTSIREINKDDAPALPYIEMYFRPGKVFELDTVAYNRPGIFKINIFTALGVGTQQGESYGGALEDLFRHQTIGGVYCSASGLVPWTEDLGIDESLQGYHHQTNIPFTVISED